MLMLKATAILLGIAIWSCQPAAEELRPEEAPAPVGEKAPPKESPPPVGEKSAPMAPPWPEAIPRDPYAEKANEAIRVLQSGLVKALTAELEKGGPEGAVFVCRDEAQAITAKVSEETGITVGRTSHLLRNAANAPREWAKSIVEDGAGKKTSDVEAHTVDLGDKVGVLKPINTLGLCTNCHGQAEEIAPEVRNALDETYPTDRAVGFSVGDLRGWMWAEVGKETQ